MAFDGIVTKAIAYELNNLVGYKIDKIYQPDSNNIVLGLYGDLGKLAINICIDSHYYRISLSTHTKPNPQNAPNFCMLLRKYISYSKIKSIYTYNLERILTIELETFDDYSSTGIKKLIIELMGKHSNIILVNEDDEIIDSLRHTSVENNSYRNIYPHQKYILPTSEKLDFTEINNFDEFIEIITPELNTYPIAQAISNKFTGISLSFVQNIVLNLNNTENIEKDVFIKIKEIINNLPNLTARKNPDKKDFVVQINNQKEPFALNFFIDDYYFEKENTENFVNYRNSLLKLILEQLKKYNKRLLNINDKLKECENMDTYKLYGELITANLYQINNQHLEKVILPNYYDNNSNITIPLDFKYTTNINAKRYFKKYNKLKNAIEIINSQKEETENELNYIESIVYELENASNLSEIQDIFEEISENVVFKDNLPSKKNKQNNSNKKKSKEQPHFNPIKYEFKDYTIYIGRNNKENDWLTTKFASKSDLWFHTKDIHGSHVILKINSKQNIEDEILVEAAKQAAKHSKAKISSNVPVDYCKVQYVKKPNHAKPGMVIYTNNKTLYVTP